MLQKRDLGNNGEAIICNWLIDKGFVLLDRNIKEKFAEIDIVARDGSALCFIEVRTRQDIKLGHPLETITKKKQTNIRRAAEAYIAKRNIFNQEIRFDVATIVWSTMEITFLKNAF